MAEVDFFLSGGAANTDPNASLGGDKSTTLVDNAAEPNLFEDIGTAEADAGSEKFRLVYIEATTKNYTDMGVWISTPTPSADTEISLALAEEGLNAPAAAIADEDTMPPNVVFTRPTQDYAMIALPDMVIGDYIGLWIQRSAKAGSAGYQNDYVRLDVEGVETP